MILLILIIGLILRILGSDQSLWLDEAITATVARDSSITDLFTYLQFDNHPPLYLFLIHLLLQMLPASDFVVRVPSIIFGVSTIYIIFLLGKELFDRKTALIASLFIATSPLHIYYSHEGRMYALNTLLVSLLILLTIKYIKNSKFIFLLGYIATGVILIYTDYLPTLIFIVTSLVILFRKKFDIKWVGAHLIIALSFIPWLPLFSKQLSLGIAGRGQSEVFDKVLGKFDPFALPLTFEKFVLGRIPVDYNLNLLFIIPSLIIFAMVLINSLKLKNERVILFGWLSLPIFIAYIASLKLPTYLFFRLIFSLPAMYLLIAGSLNSIKFRNLFLGAILLINSISLFQYYINPSFQRENWKETVGWIETELSEKDLVLFASGDPPPPYSWYRKEHPEAVGAFEGFYVQGRDVDKVGALIDNKSRIFIFTYLQDITDPERRLQKWVQENNFDKTQGKSFHGVGEVQIFKRINE